MQLVPLEMHFTPGIFYLHIELKVINKPVNNLSLQTGLVDVAFCYEAHKKGSSVP